MTTVEPSLADLELAHSLTVELSKTRHPTGMIPVFRKLNEARKRFGVGAPKNPFSDPMCLAADKLIAYQKKYPDLFL
jgi:hypothetical protein